MDYCKKTRDTWKPIEEWIASTDIIITHASIVEKYGLVRPEIQITDDSQPSEVSIKALRHPLIEAQKTRVKYVTHDIHIGGTTSGILLYGINASGKSSLMKAIGIAVILAQCGLFVPAVSMSLRPFKTIATRILNHDNIAQGMSSFTVEMSELRGILRIADHRTLVLGDEVCAGTESVSGTAIVAATLDHLLTKQSRFMFATHLHDLLKCDDIIQNPSLKVFHLHVEYDAVSDTLIYNRSLMPGNGKTYYGLEVAKALHIPIGILEKAYSIRAKLLGEGSSTSHWNSNQILESCEICKNGIHSKLEVHHIKPRKDATNKRNEDGTALNNLRNLITVCQECHDKHHAGEIEIKEAEQTSKGEQRRIIKVPAKKNIYKKYTEEQQETIRKCIIENPGVAPNLLLIKLKLDYEIDITNKDIKLFY
jgi:DNA mismatch repair protein MutS